MSVSGPVIGRLSPILVWFGLVKTDTESISVLRRGRCLLQCHRDFEAQEALELASLLVQKSKLSSDEKLKFKQDIKNNMSNGVEIIQGQANVEDCDDLHQILSPHPIIPGLSSKVNVIFDKTRGRHSVAQQEFHPGEIVSVDSPVTWCLSHNFAKTHCHHCCKSLSNSGYPSPLSRQE